MPRPLSPDPRTTTIQVRLNEAETRRLDLLRDGSTRSEFLRRPLVDAGEPEPRQPQSSEPVMVSAHRHRPAAIAGARGIYVTPVCACGEVLPKRLRHASDDALPDAP